jgi:hypothetical protein
VVRAKIVLMAADGLPNTEIAARLDGQPAPRWFIGGGNGFSIEACRAWKVTTAPGDHGSFPPRAVVEVKQLACELPATTGVPQSRWSCAELARQLIARGVVAAISAATVWRI